MRLDKTILLTLGLVALAAASCNKVLDQKPRNSTYNEEFWKDPRAGTSAVSGNYAMLRDVLSTGLYGTYNRYYVYGESAADVSYTLRSGNDGQGNIDVHNGNFSHNYVAAALGDWTGYYKTIAMSNVILKEIEKVSDEILSYHPNPEEYRKNIRGQALFIRALTYFMLVRTWGDVPLIVEAYDDPINAPHLGRTAKLEVMAQIEKDCKAAIENLKWTYFTAGDKAVTANQGAVYALLAHLYLWRGTVASVQTDAPDLQDIDKAAEAINEIETKGGYVLTDTANYYQTFIGRSAESIFEINKSESSQEGTTQPFSGLFLDNRYVSYFSANAFLYVKPDYLNSHFYTLTSSWGWVWNATLNVWEWKEMQTKVRDTKDIRLRKNFDYIESSYPTAIKYSNIIYRNPAQKLDAYFSNNMNIFRLSDMLLLKAEIALYKDQTATAIEIINGFRKRNGGDPGGYVPATATKSVVLSEYIIERGKELFLEGHLFYDLVRTRKCIDIIPWLNEQRFRKEGFYWPVAPSLFKENKYLVQTEFWKGKI